MATLKTLVDETTNIKNELVECYSNLKSNLIAKYTEVSDSDKLLDLINKVEALKVQTTVPISGENNLLYQYSNEFTHKTTSENQMCEYLYEGSNGTLKLSISLKSNGSNYATYAVIHIIRNGNDTIYKTFTHSTGGYTNYSCDIDVLKGDIISVGIKTSGFSGWAKSFKITCNYLMV